MFYVYPSDTPGPGFSGNGGVPAGPFESEEEAQAMRRRLEQEEGRPYHVQATSKN